MHKLILASAIAALPFAAFAQDDDPVAQAIKARQGFYTMLGANMGTLAAMARGDVEYDEAMAAQAAGNIEALTQYSLPIHFIEGSSNADVEGTDALPAIWENMDDFRQKFADLGEAASGAGDAVMGGQENIGPVLGQLGGACKACHDSYRD
ncbi:c-type cytochrome [Paracoccus aerodenitrificans]|uniref:c-type cytochrome n=1 Tax=Paracoccus aerodenitrificans TaxID=3017781 RepID=UPI0022F11AF7|nr:cytochrome c [Paracoccus aerodenitrificans]WBU63138.1 cytochrome c [Paracoccus aerodenitrificans]